MHVYYTSVHIITLVLQSTEVYSAQRVRSPAYAYTALKS